MPHCLRAWPRNGGATPAATASGWTAGSPRRASMTEPALATTAPVFTVNGQLVRDLARDCVRLEVTEGVEGLRTMRAHFLAVGAGATGPPQPMLHLDGRTLDLGKGIKVGVGPDSAQRFVFEGVISAIETVLDDAEPAVAVVHAEDELMRLRMTRRMKT